MTLPRPFIARALPLLLALAPGLLAAACGGGQPKLAAKDNLSGPASEKQSTAKEREEVAITVYNQNFGLVREIRKLDLGSGKSRSSSATCARRSSPRRSTSSRSTATIS